MYNQPEVALEQYEIEIRKINRGRGAYICDTDKGLKLLVPFKGSSERVDTIRRVLQFVNESGMPVEQICLTREGEVLSTDDAEIRYLLKDFKKGVECNPQNIEDVYETTRLLGRLHGITKASDIIPPEFMNKGENRILDDCRKHNKELIKIKNFVRSRKKKNEFEIMFWNQYSHFLDHALISTECQDSMNVYPPKIWCHGDYNYHNVIGDTNGFIPANFEMLEWNMGLLDLANYMRKILEKNAWSTDLGENMIEAYSKEQSLDEDEFRLLGYMLLYPEKFWKIANHYYNGHKAWVSGRDIEKLERVIEQENERIRFLQNIFSFTI